MEYKDYLEQAKKYLSGDDGLSAYREYYDKAVKSLDDRHALTKAEINDTFVTDVGNAVTQSRMNAKNIDQYMASRGLARSGEAEQERIYENLSLDNTLSSLAKERNKRLSEENASHTDALLALEGDRADKEYDAKNKADSLSFDMADKQLGMDERAEEIALDKEKTKSEHEYNEYMKRLEAELEEQSNAKKREYEIKKIADERAYNEKQTAEERAYKEKLLEEEREYEKAKTEDERAYAEKLKNEEKTLEGNEKYTPKQTAENLAKEVVKAYTLSGDKISTRIDRLCVYDFLEDFKNTSKASDEYINELESALKAMGYRELTEDEQAARAVYKDVKNRYDEWYYDVLGVYEDTRLTPLERIEEAKSAALLRQLDYCWLHTDTKEAFDSCCDMLGVSKDFKRKYESRPLVVDPDTGKTTIRKQKGE